MEKIRNFTPHPVNIVDAEGEIAVFQPEGLARVGAISMKKEPVAGIPTSKTILGEPEGLPDFEAGTFLIVSQIVKSACPRRSDLLVPAEVIRDSKGQIVGCKSLGR